MVSVSRAVAEILGASYSFIGLHSVLAMARISGLEDEMTKYVCVYMQT